jgi:hypothetical protein
MESDLTDGMEEDLAVRQWLENCLPPMKQALNLLVRGRDVEAFAIVAAMGEDVARYGPLPDPLYLDHIMWCDD